MTPQARPKEDTKPPAAPVYNLLDRLVTYPVPRAYFTHFYVFSVVSSLFWGYQILTQGPALETAAKFGFIGKGKASMSVEQVVLAWCLMSAQGLRRLVETIVLERKSASTMQLSHYIVGFLHYVGVGIAVWIEGSGQSNLSSIAQIEIGFGALPFSVLIPTNLIHRDHSFRWTDPQ